MNIGKAVKNCIFTNYAVIKGRASRGEFLSYVIFYVLFFILWDCMIMSLIGWFGDINLIDFVLLYVPFALFPPLVSVSCRRFHDCCKSAWMFLILLVPILNLYGLWVLCMTPGQDANRFGPVPPEVRLVL